ncbi:MAG TPA: acetyl-CoA C-acyltransferase family protein [Bryobacteraceae bacterium]|nr:acetyl-CoA C-acyltransferase family protein [Bryobacteraceae bacterium]
MASIPDVVVLSAARTAIGRYGGSLKDKSPSDLATVVTREAMARAGIEPAGVGHVVFGNVIHSDQRDMYLSRVAAVNAGIPVETPALTLNRLCGSGLQAIISAAQTIKLGDARAAVGGGAECMSRGQYWMPALRWGQRMSDGACIDAMVAALTDPFDNVHMGVTAENLAAKYGITREEQDEFAVESHRRAIAAMKNCRFNDQIVPIELKSKEGVVQYVTDEHPRADATVAGMAKLKPAFSKTGTVTAGNASGINDAAAAVVLMDADEAERRGLRYMARLVAYSVVGVDPKFMGIGPVPAIRDVMKKSGLTLDDMAVIELNEAFAAQSLAVFKELDLPKDRTNPNGGAIALGHPIGASGAILTVKALYELHRIQGRYALVSLCIGGGQGIAAIFERPQN